MSRALLFILLLAINYSNTADVCQSWQYSKPFITNNCVGFNSDGVIITCKSTKEKAGLCPKGCQFLLPNVNLEKLKCSNDTTCPFGYKCCPDNCYKLGNICRPAFLHIEKEPQKALV